MQYLPKKLALTYVSVGTVFGIGLSFGLDRITGQIIVPPRLDGQAMLLVTALYLPLIAIISLIAGFLGGLTNAGWRFRISIACLYGLVVGIGVGYAILYGWLATMLAVWRIFVAGAIFVGIGYLLGFAVAFAAFVGPGYLPRLAVSKIRNLTATGH